MTEPMTMFRWRGRNVRGHTVSGQTPAVDPAALQNTLSKSQIRLLHCQALPSAKLRLRARERSVMTRQLATLLHAGLPLLQALQLFEQGQAGQPALKQLASSLRQHIEAGHAFHEVLRQQTDFPALYIQLVAVGEMAGLLDDMLARLADHLEKAQMLQSRLRAALTYPVAVLVIAAAVVGVILFWVVPAFENIFRSFNAELPAVTRGVLAASRWLAQNSVWLAGLAMLSSLCSWQAWQRSEPLKRWMDAWSLRIPVLGPLLRTACQVRWARTLSTLVGAGIPLVEAMESVAPITGNRIYLQASHDIRLALTRGQSLTHALQQQPSLFSSLLIQMAQVGEASGTLEAMLEKAAVFHERELDASIAALSSLMEPALMVFLGLVIGGLVIALYLPIFQLGQAV
jgi:type IV pilus assembly protein PilC